MVMLVTNVSDPLCMYNIGGTNLVPMTVFTQSSAT